MQRAPLPTIGVKPLNQRLTFHWPTFVTFLLALFLPAAPLPTPAAESAPVPKPARIKQIDLIHFSHTDYGFTDHPSVCHELYRRYLDVALDAALGTTNYPEGSRFCWTAETTEPVRAWWEAATPARRKAFLEAIRLGQIEVSALPLNNTPFLNREQWKTMIHWLPEDLWTAVHPRTAVQNDVNGFPRAGALRLLDAGVKRLFTGINEDSGGVPFPRPAAFWWKMPDDRRFFVWLNIGYGSGFDFFEPREWRQGPVPRAADTRYRPPRSGEILRADEPAVRAAHRRCLERILEIEKSGYQADILAISITSQWRFDNDPPFPPMSDFVVAWNQLGLQPRIRLVTVSQAMDDLEKALGPSAPVQQGEWTDWWANGTASAPREVAASRMAKRYLTAAQSPLWGPMPDSARRTANELYRELCLFDEHTWGSSLSVALPYSLDTQGQFNEKARLAYRPMAKAEWLLAQRVRTRLINESEGLWLANPTKAPFSGWVKMLRTAFRDNYQSVEDPQTGQARPILGEPGLQPWGRPTKPEDLSPEDVAATFSDNVPNWQAKFWVEKLPANSVQQLRLSTRTVAETVATNPPPPTIEEDAQGWPAGATWPGMKKSLFLGGLGDFVAIKVSGFAPRWVNSDIWSAGGAQREKMRQEHFSEVPARVKGKATRQETPHTILYSQWLEHPRLKWAVRRVEIWKHESRARLTFRLNRISSLDPEIFYLAFPLPCDGVLPRFSSGGESFTPFYDQLPGTCRDYFAVDAWAHYPTPEGDWLWVTHDAPLVTLGGPQPLAKLRKVPERTALLMAMLYNNFWYTNFLGDSPGVMEFVFDLIWRGTIDGDAQAEALAQSLTLEPVFQINPAAKESPLLIKHLYQP